MKKIIMTMVAVLVIAMSAKAAEQIITFNELPITAQEFVKKHFADTKISVIMMDKDFMTTEYSIRFENNIKIEFQGNGEWDEMDSKTECLPASIFSKAIADFLNEKHAGFCIKEADKDWHKTKIELSNGVELVFGSKDEFIRYDD